MHVLMFIRNISATRDFFKPRIGIVTRNKVRVIGAGILRAINFISKAEPFDTQIPFVPVGSSVTVGEDYPFDKCRGSPQNNKQDRYHM